MNALYYFCFCILFNFVFITLNISAATKAPYLTETANFCQNNMIRASTINTVIRDELLIEEKLNYVISKRKFYVADLSDQILAVSNCFEIDSVIFTALIGHESKFFNENISPQGALGLGQLTSIALEEVAQQLHAPHVKKSHTGNLKNKNYIQKAMSCVQRKAYKYQKINFFDITSLIKYKRNYEGFFSLQHWWEISIMSRKNYLLENTWLNLIYAAVIAKVAYSNAKSELLQNSSHKYLIKGKLVKRWINNYNSSSMSEQFKHFNKTNSIINKILDLENSRDSICTNL